MQGKKTVHIQRTMQDIVHHLYQLGKQQNNKVKQIGKYSVLYKQSYTIYSSVAGHFADGHNAERTLCRADNLKLYRYSVGLKRAWI